MTTRASSPEHAALIDSLNPEQRQAVTFVEGPLLVLAGAGSGKTRVLTTRIAHLVLEHGVPPDRILAVTFTNKAAGEMRQRVSHMLDREPSGMWIGTFHALGARLLRVHAPLLGWTRTFSIFDAEQSLRQIKRTEEEVGLDPRKWSPKAIRSAISGAKNQLIGVEEFREAHEGGFDFFLRNAARVYGPYQEALRSQNAFDFDDLLVQPVRLFETHPDILQRYRERFAFVMVDEYQDTNRAQFRFLELLAEGHGNLMVVGDDDQSIYGWRGADIRNILDFEKTYPDAHLVRLELNYRSTGRILDAANAVIQENVDRKGKTLRTERAAGEPITVVKTADETDEARAVADEIESVLDGRGGLGYSEFAVLYRTNAQARALEDAFRRKGLPYQVVGGVRFYERREIQDVLAYLRLVSNPRDQGAFERIVNYPRRGIGAKSLERIVNFARSTEITVLDAARRAAEAPDLGKGARRSLEHFAGLIDRFAQLAVEATVGDVVQALVDELDLVGHLRQEGPEGVDRIDNVEELIAGALDFDAERVATVGPEMIGEFTELDLFLQQVALVAEADRHDPDSGAVTLMTLHNAKGLEFPVVFICGMEDGLFPLSRAYDEPPLMEEERRLFYVGVTRAMDKLYLVHAGQRRRAGEIMVGRMSPFVESVPPELVEAKVSTRARREGRGRFARGGRRWEPGRRAGFDEAADRPGSERAGGTDPWDTSQDPGDLEASLDQDAPRMVKGERVLHETFGSGKVLEVTGFGRDLKVTVDFDGIGRKKLLARYARLRRDFD